MFPRPRMGVIPDVHSANNAYPLGRFMKVRFSDVPSHSEDAPQTNVLREWVSPRVQILPRLSDLTLQTGAIPGGGGTGGGGSTVVP